MAPHFLVLSLYSSETGQPEDASDYVRDDCNECGGEVRFTAVLTYNDLIRLRNTKTELGANEKSIMSHLV